jgi:hypothetical protein
MAREVRNITGVAEVARWAYLAVNAAMPLPFPVAGIVPDMPSAQDEHLMALREIAFGTLLEELLACDCEISPDEQAALERGEILPDPDREA